MALGALEQGLIYSLLAVGVFVSLRILDIPDLTVDGSFITGSAVSVMITQLAPEGGASALIPALSLPAALAAGALAGICTGLIHTKLKVQPLLAGIITMTGLFSINLLVLNEKPTVSINGRPGIFSVLYDLFSVNPTTRKIVAAALLLVIVALVAALLTVFLKTQLGLAIRATGDNEDMVRASSIDSDNMKIIGLAIANGIVALSGAVLAQHQNFADAKAGTGMVVVGIASIIIGETLFGKRSVFNSLLSAIGGALAYRIFIAVVLQLGLKASYFKLLSAVIIIISILIPIASKSIAERRAKEAKNNADD